MAQEQQAAARPLTAERLKHRFAWLQRFSDEELRLIAVCDEEVPLEPGELYFDLSNPEKGVILGQAGAKSPPGSCYVARSRVRPETWEKLISDFR